jgi:hypothetical protein
LGWSQERETLRDAFLGSQKTVGQTMAMTSLAELVTGEMVGMIGNDHGVLTLQEASDFLMGALQMVYACCEYSDRGQEGGQSSNVHIRSSKRLNLLVVAKLKREMGSKMKRATQDVDTMWNYEG